VHCNLYGMKRSLSLRRGDEPLQVYQDGKSLHCYERKLSVGDDGGAATVIKVSIYYRP